MTLISDYAKRQVDIENDRRSTRSTRGFAPLVLGLGLAMVVAFVAGAALHTNTKTISVPHIVTVTKTVTKTVKVPGPTVQVLPVGCGIAIKALDGDLATIVSTASQGTSSPPVAFTQAWNAQSVLRADVLRYCRP